MSGELGEPFGEVKRPFSTFLAEADADFEKWRNPHESSRKFPFRPQLWNASGMASEALGDMFAGESDSTFFSLA